MKRKVVTLCGSMKFLPLMQETAEIEYARSMGKEILYLEND